MTSNDDWVKARAVDLSRRCFHLDDVPEAITAITAALHEAIARGKAEQDKAVASAVAELNDTHAALVRRHADLRVWQQRAEAAEAKLARLENPDEALVEAVANEYRDPTGKFMKWRFLPEGTRVDYMNDARAFLRALARTLTGDQENKETT